MRQHPSFAREVLTVAWSHSRALLRSRLLAGLTTIASLVIGILSQWLVGGLAPNWYTVLGTSIASLVTALVLFAVYFLCRLFLAPSEVVYEALRPLIANTSIFGVARPANYSIWKIPRSYTIAEFACLLAGMDPSSHASTSDSQSYVRILLEEVQTGNLKYTRPTGWGPDAQYNPDMNARLAKDDALAWAEANGFAKAALPLR